jgi:hypothetical protein
METRSLRPLLVAPLCAALRRRPSLSICWRRSCCLRFNEMASYENIRVGVPRDVDETLNQIRSSIRLRAGDRRMRILVAAKPRSDIATKWRKVIAMGVSPWNIENSTRSPKGTKGTRAFASPFRPFGPSGLPRCSCYRIHGLTRLTPMATSFRPSGTRRFYAVTCWTPT